LAGVDMGHHRGEHEGSEQDAHKAHGEAKERVVEEVFHGESIARDAVPQKRPLR